MSYYVYLLRCCDDSLYTGWTRDIAARVKTHNAGTGAKYTRARLPVVLVYHEELADRRQALQREYALRNLKRSEKLALVSTYQKSLQQDEIASPMPTKEIS